MRSKKFRLSRCLNPSQILQKVKKQIQRDKQYQKIQQNLLYLNNSFNNNIQIQQIFIDICKGKKKNIRSKQLKTMYGLFSENKANLCIFQKIAKQQKQRLRSLNAMNQSTFSKWAKDSRGLVQIIEQEQPQSHKNLKTMRNSTDSQIQLQSAQNVQKSQQSSDNKQLKHSRKRDKSSSIISGQSNDSIPVQEQKQFQFLLRRIYCRIIQKILIKIAFYTMNNKFLDFIALNILQITKNLQTIIRRLAYIKDLRLLQQIITKVYQQNMGIQAKIYEMLVDGGYILSIDQFYRVNGIDVAHKDIFQRSSTVDNERDKKKKRYTLKQKIMKIKQKKQKQNVVKKDYIDRANKQINQKYLFCISQMRKIIQQEEEEENQEPKIPQTKPKQPKKMSIFSKTQPLSRASYLQKPSRFSKATQQNINQDVNQNISKQPSQSTNSRRGSAEIIRKKSSKSQTLYQLSKRISTFSAQFSKLIKNSQSTNKLQRNSAIYSQKFLKFNQFEKKLRKQSKTHSQNQDNQSSKQKYFAKVKKSKKSELFQGFAINKLLRLYQMRNTDRYSVDDFLGESLRLPQNVKQGLKEQLLQMKCMYDPNSKRTSNKSSFQMQASLRKNNSQRLQSAESSLSPKYGEANDDATDRSFQKIKQKDKNNRFSSPAALLKKQFNYKQNNQNLCGKQSNQLAQEGSALTHQKDLHKNEGSEQRQQKIVLQKQFSLVKLQKDRGNIKLTQKISPFNNSLFTNIGVKNLIQPKTQNQFVPLRNQKLKKIPYIRIKQQNQIKINVKSNCNSIKQINEILKDKSSEENILQFNKENFIRPQDFKIQMYRNKTFHSFGKQKSQIIKCNPIKNNVSKLSGKAYLAQNKALNLSQLSGKQIKDNTLSKAQIPEQRQISAVQVAKNQQNDISYNIFQSIEQSPPNNIDETQNENQSIIEQVNKFKTFYPRFLNNDFKQAQQTNKRYHPTIFKDRVKRFNTYHYKNQYNKNQYQHNYIKDDEINKIPPLNQNNIESFNSKQSKNLLQKLNKQSNLYNNNKINLNQKESKHFLEVYDIRRRQIIYQN